MTAGRWIAGILAALGFLALGYCAWIAVKDDRDLAKDSATCKDELPFDATDRTSSDEDGILRILGVWPEEIEIGNHFCVAIAGATTLFEETRNTTTVRNARDALGRLQMNYDPASATSEETTRLNQAIADLEAARQEASRPRAPVELAIFLNDALAPFGVRVEPQSTPQIARFRLEAYNDAEHAGAGFWRDLLRGTTIGAGIEGTLPVRLGLSRVADVTSLPDAVSEQTFTLEVFAKGAFLWGLAGLAMLVASFALFAWATTLLRDNKATAGELRGRLTRARADADAIRNDAAKSAEDRAAAESEYARADRNLSLLGTRSDTDPAGSFSLGRSQMAVWFFLVIVAFVFIAMTLGQYQNLISENVLVLLGISGATGLAAIRVTGDKAADRPSKNFVYDILCDADGPQLQRIQAVAWTFVLGGIFAWVALQDFRLVAFDTNLLLLMGIASSLYLGFKFQES